MVNIPLFKVNLPENEKILPEIARVFESGYVGEGEEVFAFEREFGDFVGNSNMLMFNSGTAALHTALFLAGVERGDEVISTALTAEPTNIAIGLAGAKVVWADIDPATGNISPESVRQKITPKTKAIMAVDYAGTPVDLAGLSSIAKDAGIYLIEDAAHALGAKYKGSTIGSHADFVAFSFQSIKHMTTTDGGALAVKDPKFLNDGKKFRWFGLERGLSREANQIEFYGYKYHMNNLMAVIGRTQLKTIQGKIDRHVECGKFFDENLSSVDGLTTLNWGEGVEPSYWLYTIKAERRDELVRYLESKGIASGTVHKRNDLHPVFRESRSELPNLDAFCKEYIHLPCGWWMSPADCEYVVETLRSGW